MSIKLSEYQAKEGAKRMTNMGTGEYFAIFDIDRREWSIAHEEPTRALIEKQARVIIYNSEGEEVFRIFE